MQSRQPTMDEYMKTTNEIVAQLKQAGQDEEWYPTTPEMIDVVRQKIPENTASILDIGAGDGRVLAKLAEKCKHAELYSIEISTILVQAQPKNIIPLGTDLFEQNLSCLPVDYIFCNPRYSQFEEWVIKIIDEGFAKKAFLVIPQRWNKSNAIEQSVKKRGASTRVIHSGDFLDAERKARAVIDIVEVTYPKDRWGEKVTDPFDIWFDQNVGTFDKAEEVKEPETSKELARRFSHSSIDEMVEAYHAEHLLLETNYRKIFELDYEILRELGVNKDQVRGGLKKKMAGLKVKYWEILFDRLDAITSRLTTASKKNLLDKLMRNTSVEFTSSNAYAVVIWSIKNANQYFEEQLITLFRELSTFDGVMGYKSNEKTWGKDHWRYMHWNEYEAFHPNYGEPKVSRYALDYRIVVSRWNAIHKDQWSGYEYPGELHRGCHELIADVIAVFSNLGFSTYSLRSLDRHWEGGEWQDWYETNSDKILFQVKGYMNGNLHFRFMPEAIKALNIEAGRLLKWVRTAEEVVTEMGYTPADAKKYFNHNMQIEPSNVKLLGGGG